jgi:hypothetical protein
MLNTLTLPAAAAARLKLLQDDAQAAHNRVQEFLAAAGLALGADLATWQFNFQTGAFQIEIPDPPAPRVVEEPAAVEER